MRHSNSGRKLGRTASHRKAMLTNMAVSIIDKERVTTTVQKAKEVRRRVERLITYGKKGGLHAIRVAARYIHDKTILKKLFDDIAPGYASREGGYTRIVKIGVRKGDNAEMALIELVARKGDDKRKRRGKRTPNLEKTALKNQVEKPAGEAAVAETVAVDAEGPAEDKKE
jgi:large subunit ribosomal protein L17